MADENTASDIAELERQIEIEELEKQIASEEGGAGTTTTPASINDEGGFDVLRKAALSMLMPQAGRDIIRTPIGELEDTAKTVSQTVLPAMAGGGAFSLLRSAGPLAGGSKIAGAGAGALSSIVELLTSQGLEEAGIGEGTDIVSPMGIATTGLGTLGGLADGVQAARTLTRGKDTSISRVVQTAGGKPISSKADIALAKRLARGEHTLKGSKIFKNTGPYDPITGKFAEGTGKAATRTTDEVIGAFDDAISRGAKLRTDTIKGYEDGLAMLNEELVVGPAELAQGFAKSAKGKKVLQKISSNSQFSFMRDNSESMVKVIDEIISSPGTKTSIVDEFGVPMVSNKTLGISGLDSFVKAIDDKLRALEAFDPNRIAREGDRASSGVIAKSLDNEAESILEQLASKDFTAVSNLLSDIRGHVVTTRNGLIDEANSVLLKNSDSLPDHILKLVTDVPAKVFKRNLDDTHNFIVARDTLQENLIRSVPKEQTMRAAIDFPGARVSVNTGESLSPLLEGAERAEFTGRALNEAAQLTELDGIENFFQLAADTAPAIGRTSPRLIQKMGEVDIKKNVVESVDYIQQRLSEQMESEGIQDFEAKASELMSKVMDTLRKSPREAAFQLAEIDSNFNIFEGKKLPGSIMFDGKRIVPNPQTKIQHKKDAKRLLRSGKIDSEQYHKFVSGMENGLTYIPDELNVDTSASPEVPTAIDKFKAVRGGGLVQ